MKFLLTHIGRVALLSLPARGAWIEIAAGRAADNAAQRRSPHGERGLKWKLDGDCRTLAGSLPARGAWIEMCRTQGLNSALCRRSPHGERGLKYDKYLHLIKAGEVAPRTGSVD